MSIDSGLFADVADALGIDSPAIVEKDVYAVQLLSQLSKLDLPCFDLVFAGGTSLAKAHRSIFRMSEDIDIKLVAREAAVSGMSRTAMKVARKTVLADIEALIASSRMFELDDVIKRNEYRYGEYTVRYPRSQGSISALRPDLRLDITASRLLESSMSTPVSSLYADALRLPPEIKAFPVVGLYSTVSEKLVALLRRTAHVDRDASRKDDETLVRHVYDLHMVAALDYDPQALRPLVDAVIREDVEQFGRQHPEFLESPKAELHHGLACLRADPIHQLRYERFIGPLVYHETPASWDEALQSVMELVQQLIIEV